MKAAILALTALLTLNLYADDICSSSKPAVIYLDDVGVADGSASRVDDPNGVQDLAIVLQWSKYMNLIAVGSTSRLDNKPNTIQLVKNIVTASELQTPVYAGKDLIDLITIKAREAASCNNGKKLELVIGGEWHEVMCALRSDPFIADHIKITGITSTNIRPNFEHSNARDLAFCMGSGEKLSPRESFVEIQSKVKKKDIFIIADYRTVPATVPTGIRDFVCHENRIDSDFDIKGLNSFYDEAISPILSKAKDPISGKSLSDPTSNYIKHAVELAKAGCNHESIPNSKRVASKLRIADFLAMAHVLTKETNTDIDYLDRATIFEYIKGNETFSKDTSFMVPIIQTLLSED